MRTGFVDPEIRATSLTITCVERTSCVVQLLVQSITAEPPVSNQIFFPHSSKNDVISQHATPIRRDKDPCSLPSQVIAWFIGIEFPMMFRIDPLA